MASLPGQKKQFYSYLGYLSRTDESRLIREEPQLQILCPRTLGVFHRDKGHSVDRKSHPYEHMIYCFEGEGYLEEKETFPLKKGDLIFIDGKRPHRFGSSRKHPYSLMWLTYTGDRTAAFAKALGVHPLYPLLSLSFEQEKVFFRFFEELLRVFINPTDRNNLVYASSLITHYLNSLRLEADCGIQSRYSPFSSRIITYLKENARAHYSLAGLADFMNCSPQYLCRKFKDDTGQTPGGYHLALKVEDSKELLLKGESIETIADKLGFSDRYHFSKVFKRIEQITPGRYGRMI